MTSWRTSDRHPFGWLVPVLVCGLACGPGVFAAQPGHAGRSGKKTPPAVAQNGRAASPGKTAPPGEHNGDGKKAEPPVPPPPPKYDFEIQTLDFAQAVTQYEEHFDCKVFFSAEFRPDSLSDTKREAPRYKKVDLWVEYIGGFLALSKPVKVDTLNDLIITRIAEMVPGQRMLPNGMTTPWPWYDMTLRAPLLRWGEWRTLPRFKRGELVARAEVLSTLVGSSFATCSRDTYYKVLRRDHWLGVRSPKSGMWGYMDRAGKWRIEPQFEAVGAFVDDRAPAKARGRWGFIDAKGRWRVEPRFTEVRPYAGGLAAVRAGSRWGFVDESGALVAPPRFDEVGPLSEDRAPVRLGQKWGYIDQRGELAVPLKYDFAGPFSEDRGGVLLGDRFGYLDRKGRWAVYHRFRWGTAFEDGRAWVLKGRHWGWVDREGDYIYMPGAASTFDEGANDKD